jgi:competence protein ComEC
VGSVLLASVTLLFVLGVRLRASRVVVMVALLVALVVQLPVRGVVSDWPAPHWLMVACDVGQGDALVLSTGPEGGGSNAVVIDTGPDPVAVDRCLAELGVRRVRLLVLTHDHLDHVGGIDGVAHTRAVDGLLSSPLPEPPSGQHLIDRAGRRLGLVPSAAVAGTHLEIGALRLDVLGPTRIARGSRSDPNNTSIVVRATVAGHLMMLPGDAEVEEQDDLLASGTGLAAEVLKVPHHGSAWSDPSFLRAVGARVAIVSVGAHNDYGHPSPSLVSEIAAEGIPLFRTDRNGDIAITQTAHGLVPVLRRDSGGDLPRSLSRLEIPSGAVERAVQPQRDAERRPAECHRPLAGREPVAGGHRTGEICGVRSGRSKEPSCRGPPGRTATEQQGAEQRVPVAQ